jgi:L-cysteate sulfo-lyase
VTTPADLTAALDRLPRVPLAVTPTPLQELPGLAAALGVPSLLVKRDDLTGLAFGGNKVRMLEYFTGAAVEQGCDVFVGGGGAAQSNHARLCAAAARKAGLDPVIVLRTGASDPGPSGNRLITELLGADIRWFDGDPHMTNRFAASEFMDEVAAELRAAGRRPYVLHSSVHPLGLLAYLECAAELAEQLAARGVERAAVVATSEGSVTAGLQLAARLLGLDWQVTGVTCRPWAGDDATTVPARLAVLARDAAALIGLTSPLDPADFAIIDEGPPGYGIASEAAWDAIALCARTDALLLDPVYTAKGMAGLLRLIRDGAIGPDRTPVFVHTGGLPALFAQPEAVLDAVRRRSGAVPAR